ncbi:hypothetical protein C8Q76DRAFT_695833 [Earliella scabrosa]|nr:hypothetical protein C8Q76DRAFT_695833 [Earliella scabrosa]
MFRLGTTLIKPYEGQEDVLTNRLHIHDGKAVESDQCQPQLSASLSAGSRSTSPPLPRVPSSVTSLTNTLPLLPYGVTPTHEPEPFSRIHRWSLISRQSLGRLREAQRMYTLLRNSRRVRRLRYQSLAIYQRLGILRDGVQALSPSSLHLWIVLAILIVLTGVMIVVWEWTFKEGDNIRIGRLLDDRTIWGHTYAQRERRKLEGATGGVEDDNDHDSLPQGMEGELDASPPSQRPRRAKRSAQRQPQSAPLKDEGVRRRIRDLGALESSIALRSRLVNPFTKLRFLHQPNSLNDSPSELDETHSGSAEFIVYRRWLIAKQKGLQTTRALGDKDADARLGALINQLESERERLRGIRRVAWHKEMLAAGVIRMEVPRTLAPVLGPDVHIFDPKKSQWPWFVMVALFATTILHSIAAVSRHYICHMPGLLRDISSGSQAA